LLQTQPDEADIIAITPIDWTTAPTASATEFIVMQSPGEVCAITDVQSGKVIVNTDISDSYLFL